MPSGKIHFVTLAAACGMLFLVAVLAVPHAAAATDQTAGTVRTKDGVSIAYEHYRNGSDTVIIVCPGFYNSKINRWMKRTVELLSPAYDVIIFDFRGHGESGGRFMWSSREDQDVTAILDYARGRGYKHIGIVGFSLGGAAAVNAVAAESGETKNAVESMILISCPYRIGMIDFRFWMPEMFTDLFDNISCGWEGKGARCGNPFLGKTEPVDSIRALTGIPLLIIHGDHDWIIKARHAEKLFAAAGGQKKLEIIKGGWHAEQLIEHQFEQMKSLILGWFSQTVRA